MWRDRPDSSTIRYCEPEWTRTIDSLIKSEVLYPTELRVHSVEKVGYAPTPVDFQSTASTKLASSPMVGVRGLEPLNSEERRFTVSSNCRYAILPIVEDIGFEPMTLAM